MTKDRAIPSWNPENGPPQGYQPVPPARRRGQEPRPPGPKLPRTPRPAPPQPSRTLIAPPPVAVAPAPPVPPPPRRHQSYEYVDPFYSEEPFYGEAAEDGGSGLETTAPGEPIDTEMPPSRPLRPRIGLFHRWQFWSVMAVATFSGIAAFSAVSLFRIPGLPNCRAIFWPTASASMRIQCAEAYAEQGNVDDLLAAIDLVGSLPDDHPLRQEIDDRIESWANKILVLADDLFHQGELAQAITTARRIPAQTAAAQLVNDRIETWEGIWLRAEDLYESATAELQQLKFREAFNLAVQLLDVGNRYWETTRYNELTQLITATREEGGRLGEAQRLAERGGLSNLSRALDMVGEIPRSSPVFAEAQRLTRDFSRQLLSLAEDTMAAQDFERAEEILAKIPASTGLAAEVRDLQTFAQAYALVGEGRARNYEAAIAQLQSIGRDRPLYSRAQTLIGTWQQQTMGVAQLEAARRIADPGGVGDLRAAIATARQIERTNPRWDEAQTQINRWQAQIETVEDQPTLVRAEQYANQGNLNGLRAAITEARTIRAGRALYSDAQSKIRTWQAQVQRIEDQPLLNQARQLADGGRIPEAIAVANQITSSRALYDTAQQDIRTWQGQAQGQRRLADAYASAQSGSVDGLTTAIQFAQQVPSSSSQHSEAISAANRWSWDLLQLAESAATSNLSRAVSLVSRIPARTEAYATAQLRLQEWQAQLTSINQSVNSPEPEQPPLE